MIALPRPLRPLVQRDPIRAHSARLDLGAMLGLATIALGEPTAYAIMGALSARLPLPTGQYVVAAPQRLPGEDERVDVIFSAVLIVPFLVLLIAYGWLEQGLVCAAAW